MFAAIIATLAFLTKGLTGFANTLVFNSGMSYIMPNKGLAPIELLLGLPANLFITIKERQNVRLKVVLPLSIALLLGMLPATFLLKTADETVLKFFMGITILLLAVEMYFRERGTQKAAFNPTLLFLIGVGSGVLCGLFGIGAFLVAYISRTTETSQEVRANICCVFIIENLMRLAVYGFGGILTTGIFMETLKLFPFMVVGLGAGLWLSKRIPENNMKNIVIILLGVMGISVALSNAWFLYA